MMSFEVGIKITTEKILSEFMCCLREMAKEEDPKLKIYGGEIHKMEEKLNQLWRGEVREVFD